MAAGRPIIGLLDENSEIGLTIKKFDCGVVWNTNSKKSLSSLLKELLADTEKLERMAQNSYNAFLVNYDISISANKYNLMIAGIVKK